MSLSQSIFYFTLILGAISQQTLIEIASDDPTALFLSYVDSNGVGYGCRVSKSDFKARAEKGLPMYIMSAAEFDSKLKEGDNDVTRLPSFVAMKEVSESQKLDLASSDALRTSALKNPLNKCFSVLGKERVIFKATSQIGSDAALVGKHLLQLKTDGTAGKQRFNI